MNSFTTLADQFDFYDEGALEERLTAGVSRSGKPVVFLVGSALTAPANPGDAGVPGVDGIISLITEEFDEERRQELNHGLLASDNPYQAAFRFLLGRRGPPAANEIIRRAVAAARKLPNTGGSNYVLDASTSDQACRSFDADIAGWVLSPGVTALGNTKSC